MPNFLLDINKYNSLTNFNLNSWVKNINPLSTNILLFPNLKIHREDERFTSKLSSIYLNQITKKRKVKIDKKNLDKISASIILDSYLKKNKWFYQFYHMETQF